MIRNTVLGAAIALGLSMAASANAQEASGFYFGANFGEASVDLDQDELDLIAEEFALSFGTITSADSSLEDSDSSFAVFAGYRFNPYIAVEAGYLDLGTAEYDASGTVNPFGPATSAPVAFDAEFETTGFTLAGVGSIPLGEMFDLHARLGYFFSDTEITLTGSYTGVSASEDLSGSDQDLFYGVGLGFNLGAHWSFSLDWAQYKDVGSEDDTGEEDMDNIALSLMYRM